MLSVFLQLGQGNPVGVAGDLVFWDGTHVVQ
jgi:hypothetical protein